MHPAFESIRYGPFSTEYHRSAVTADFRDALSRFLEQTVLPQVDEPYDSTQGTLTAAFDEEKFCRPSSPVKDIYKIEFEFIRQGSSDRLRDELRFGRESGVFFSRWKERPVILWTNRRRERERRHLPAVEGMLARIMKHEPGTWLCPRCDAELNLIDTDELVELRCPRGCFMANDYRRPKGPLRARYNSYPRCSIRAHPEMRGVST